MKRVMFVLLILLFGLSFSFATVAEWPMHGLNLNRTNWDGENYTIINGLSSASLWVGHEISNITIANGYVYAATSDDSSSTRLYQLNASNVSQVLYNVSNLGGNSIMQPVVSGNYVYVTLRNSNQMYQLNATNISHIIVNATHNNIFGTGGQLIVEGDSVFFPNYNNKILRLNASNVSQVLDNATYSGLLNFATVQNDSVYITNYEGSLYHINRTNLSQLFSSTSLGSASSTAPMYFNNSIYSGNGGTLYRLNASNVSQVLDSYNTGSNGISSPAIVNNYTYISVNSGVYQLNVNNLSDVVSNLSSQFANALSVLNNFVYLTTSNVILQLNTSNVSFVIANISVPYYGNRRSLPAITTDYAYFGANSSIIQLNASNISFQITSESYSSPNVTFSSGATSYSINDTFDNPGSSVLFNLSVNNTYNGSNITQVNFTLSSGIFTFILGSNATSSTGIFSNSSNLLHWVNASLDLISGLSAHYFWFNLSAPTPGNYNFSVSTLNSSNELYTSNLSITVLDVSAPRIQFVNITPSNASNVTNRNGFVLNVTATDNDQIGNITIRLFNSSGLVNTSLFYSSPSFVNFTSLADETYTFNATANDSTGNANVTSSFVITLDSNSPLVEYTTGVFDNGSNVSASSIFINVTVTEPNEANITFMLSNASGLLNSTTLNDSTHNITFSNLIDGLYSYNVTVVDNFGRSNTTNTRNITLDTVSPNVTLIAPVASTSSTTSAYSFIFNATESNAIANCSLLIDASIVNTSTSINASGGNNTIYYSSISVGTHTWSVNCTDYAGNIGNTTSRSLIVTASTSSSSSNGGGGGGSSSGGSVEGTKGFPITSQRLKNGIEKRFFRGGKTYFKNWKGENHSLTINQIVNNTVNITIQSEPINLFLSDGDVVKLNISSIEMYDLQITVNSINSVFANITLQEISEPNPNYISQNTHSEINNELFENSAEQTDKQSEVTSSTNRSLKKNNLLWIIIFIVICFVVFFFLWRHYFVNKNPQPSKKVISKKKKK